MTPAAFASAGPRGTSRPSACLRSELLERDARPEPQGPGAEASDRSGRELDDPGSPRVPAQLRVDGTVDEAERLRAGRRGCPQRRLRSRGQARRRHVNGLLEEGAVQGVGLVEERERRELAPRQQPFERHLSPLDEVLHEDLPRRPAAPRRDVRRRENAGDPAPGGFEAGRIVRADDAAAARENRRLEDAGVGHISRDIPGIRTELEHPMGGRRRSGPGQPLPQPTLVPSRRDRFDRVVRKPERLRDRGGRDHRVLVDADDGLHRPPPRPRGRGARTARRVPEVERQEPRRVQVLDRARLLGRDRHVDAERRRRAEKVRGAVGRRRKEQKNAGHAAILAGSGRGRAVAARTDTVSRCVASS